MEIKEFEKLGEFNGKVTDDCLVVCPHCKGSYGVKKWLRLATEDGLECPGCNMLFETDMPFDVKPVVRIQKEKKVKAEAKDKVVARERLSVSALSNSNAN